MNEKKKEELFYLKRFLSLLGKVPKGDIICGESPDFIVSLKGKKVGIEITEHHSAFNTPGGQPRRAIEQKWVELQREIMERVEKHKELQETNGLLFFKNLWLPSKSETTEFIDALVTLSLKMVREGIQEKNCPFNYTILNKYLRKFFLKWVGAYVAWEWNNIAAWVGLSEEELLKTIESKLLADYRDKNIDKLWLLIVSGYRLSQAMGVNLTDKLNSFLQVNRLLERSKYNKLFIYQLMFDDIYEWPGWNKLNINKQ